MARASKAIATRELPDTLSEDPPKGWEVKDLWPMMRELSSKATNQVKKIRRLEETVSEYTDPSERLMSGLAETGVAALGGFANPFLVAMLGDEWQEFKITEDFAVDTEAITAGLGYGLGLYMYWQDVSFGKWVFEAGKGAVASYAGHIGRKLGAEYAAESATA
jgi:hypothetical protein